VPSARLAAAQQAFAWGDYPRARDGFAALLADPGAQDTEIQLAAFWLGRSALEAKDYDTALAALQDFILTYPSDPRVASAQFLKARAYESLGDWQKVIDAYQAYVDTEHNILDVYAFAGLGNAALLALDFDRASQAYADGMLLAPDNGWAVQMREGIALSQLAQDNSEAAIEQYDAILSIARIPTYRAKILYLAGQASAQGGDAETAYERYNEAVNRYPEAYNSYLALVELVNAGVPVDDFQRGLVDYHARAYQPAIDAFNRYIQANPQSHNGDAHWYLALSLKANGDLWQSIQHFKELIETHPQSEHADEAWLEMAEAFAWRGNQAQALETYRTFVEENPQSALAANALWEAAELHVTNEDLVEAAASFRDLADRYPEDEDAPEALFKAALLDYRRAEFESARDGWQLLIREFPNSRAGLAARFWLGKAWLALDNWDQSRAAFEAAQEWAATSYYGLRAAEMMQDPPAHATEFAPLNVPDANDGQDQAEAWLASWLPITNTLALASQEPIMARSPAFQRGDALMAVGMRAEALEEFETIKNTWWDDPLAMYQLALSFRDRGLYRLSILCAERLIWLSPVNNRTEAPVLVQRLSYPLYYHEIVTAEAEAEAADPLLLFALIRQESLFEPSSASTANAQGLTQVIPATGEWVAGRLGWEDYSEEDLTLPFVNIRFGTWYLSFQLSTFDEQLVAALAAYNAGPGRIHDWLTDTPDLDVFVETMPFFEPRLYVRRVYENYAHYRRLYRQDPQSDQRLSYAD
jgi:soluble lytic murein transglycosylase